MKTLLIISTSLIICMMANLESVSQRLLSSNDYTNLTRDIATIRSNLRSNHIPADSLSKLFTTLLTDKLLPQWLGTPWAFEGYTAVPNEGAIACGYFVSTTLLHMGFNLNRYKFAQQLPVNEAKTLNLGKGPLEISSPYVSERIEKLLDTLPDGLHFIGFDQSHVGYVLRQGENLEIIHSNYINAEGVVREKAEESLVFSYYSTIYITEISTNQKLMQRWIKGEPIRIYPE